MKTTRLGTLEVTVLGLGCMSMSQSYGEADAAESARTLHRALDVGVKFLDTANAYGMGHNEELLGRVLAGRRHEFKLATKFGIVKSADGKRGIDGHPAQVAARCEESLKRLRTDHIDLYYLHRLDPKVPIEDTVGAMAALVKAGKIGHIGLSEISSKTLRRAHAVHPISAVQSEYSLWTRDPERHVLPTCRELGIGFVIAVIAGDGIGKEVMPEGVRVMEAAATQVRHRPAVRPFRLRQLGLLREARQDAARRLEGRRSAATTRSTSARSAGPTRSPTTCRCGARCCCSAASSTSTSTCARCA
jgi:aryl-alcohol dehydrogenase-like predicted oxidoreductase